MEPVNGSNLSYDLPMTSDSWKHILIDLFNPPMGRSLEVIVNIFNTSLHTDTDLCAVNAGHMAGGGSEICCLYPLVAGSWGFWVSYGGHGVRGRQQRGYLERSLWQLLPPSMETFLYFSYWRGTLCAPAKHTQWVSSQAPRSDLRLLSPPLRAFNIYTRKCLAFWSLWTVLWWTHLFNLCAS